MNQQQKTRAKNCILGALVADAATMGFHWLYSQKRILKLAPERPEFRDPSAEDYRGNVGYFAHPLKKAGEFSHYGEQCLVMLDSMVKNSGRYNRQRYQEQFRTHFGYGGEFVGYIDRPTRQTLDTIYRTEHEALEHANSIAYKGDSRQKQGLLTKVLAAAKRYQGEKLLSEAQHFAESTSDPDEARQYIQALVDALGESADFPGAIDEQLPAVSKLPPLVAVHADSSELLSACTSAIKVTNNTPRAIDYGMVCSEMMRAVVQGESVASAIDVGIAAATDTTRDQLEAVLRLDYSVSEMTTEYGLHCDLGSGIPSVVFNLKSATSYVEAIRRNILAGGDNCGRAIVLGAVCGSFFGTGGDSGIPEEWLARLYDHHRIEKKIDQLFSEV
jgi:ADP-ribosylglycohydrolase